MSEAVIGHAGDQTELRRLAATEAPPHSFLLAGAEGTGRTLLATTYARILNCEADDRPCGECRPCRLIATGRHPDVVAVGPGDTLCRPRADSSHAPHPTSRDIRICQVRGIIDAVARYPIEARTRVVIIEPAHAITSDAAQALLKTLEEPPGHTVLMLISSAPERLLETIISRCRRIDVRLVPTATIEQGLAAGGVAPDLARRCAEHARGLPARAVTLAGSPGLIDAAEKRRTRCAQLARSGIGARLDYATEVVEMWRRDRALVADELAAWEMFWRDTLRQSAAVGAEATALASVGALQAVDRARLDLDANVSPRGALELMLVSFPAGTMVTAVPAEPDGARAHPETT